MEKFKSILTQGFDYNTDEHRKMVTYRAKQGVEREERKVERERGVKRDRRGEEEEGGRKRE